MTGKKWRTSDGKEVKTSTRKYSLSQVHNEAAIHYEQNPVKFWINAGNIL